MSAIYDRPNEYDFGLDFDYSVWTEHTTLEFLTVPWDAMYRDVVRFSTRDELNRYIDQNLGERLSIEELSYIKPGTPIYVDFPHNAVNRFNYIRVRNPLMPVDSDVQKDFYYFITGVEFVAPNTTAIFVQLDVWQTYIYDIQFGNCYIERGHIGIANTKNFDSFGRDYLTVPEGIDVGTDTRIIARRKNRIMGFYPLPGTTAEVPDYSVVMVTTQDIDASPVDGGGKAVITTAGGSSAERIPSGASLYAFPRVSSFTEWLLMNKQYAWRTQSIVGVYIVPDLARYDPDWRWDNPDNGHAYDMSDFRMWPRKLSFFDNWRNSPEILNVIPERYRHLKKLFTSPYMGVEMTTWVGTPIVLKPEMWASANADVLERATMTPPAQRIEFIPRRYNSLPGGLIDNWMDLPDGLIPDYKRAIGDDGGEWLDLATRISNFPSVPIVSNAGVAYLASNQASIHQAYANADWSQQRALAGNQLSFDQSNEASKLNDYRDNTSRTLMESMNNIGNQRMINNTNISTAASVAKGVVMNSDGNLNPLAILGNGIDAIANNASSIANIQSNNDALNAGLLASRNNTEDNRRQERYMRDTNKEYQDFAAKGDYAQTIATLDAKVRDAAMMQPTMSSQFGGEVINLVNNSAEVSLRWRLIDNSGIATIGEFWLQFGYAVHRSVAKLPENLMVMTNFTYWKLQKVYLRSGPMPESHRQTVRGIMESGVTVWNNPNNIGFTDFADNRPLEGITL